MVSIRKSFLKIWYRLLVTPRGLGIPTSKEASDNDYRKGKWDFLDSMDEMVNYMVVVGYVSFLSKQTDASPSILDFGCGSGNMAELLGKQGLDDYLGIDISEEAIKRAANRGLHNAEFQVDSFEDFESDRSFDFIISTGSLHHAKDPALLLERLSKNFSGDGKFVISLWRHGHHRAIWKRIEKRFTVVDSTTVENQKGLKWDIKVLEKPAG